MRKILLSILLCIALTLSLACCGKKNANGNGGNNSSATDADSGSTGSPNKDFPDNSKPGDLINDKSEISGGSFPDIIGPGGEIVFEGDNISFTSSMPATLSANPSYTITNFFKTSYFSAAPEVFSKDIALFSFGMSVANSTETEMKKFFDGALFDSQEYYGYDSAPTDNSIAYAIAHKSVGDFNLIAVSVRGFNYGREWADNFNVGSYGHHQGFSAQAVKVNGSLSAYLSDYGLSPSSNKFLITGYSRGGAVANTLGSILNGAMPIDGVTDENAYVYTFEAPKSVPIAKETSGNIHNIVSSADFITHLTPDAYGLKRDGVDHDIFSENFVDHVAEFDDKLIIPEFYSDPNNYPTAADLYSWAFEQLLVDPVNAGGTSIKTRADFYNNLQPSLMKIMAFLMNLSGEETYRLNAYMSDLTNMFALMNAVYEQDGIYDFFKTALDACLINYNDDELKSCATAVQSLIAGYDSSSLAIVAFLSMFNNIDHIMAMHTPEVIYPMLLNY